MLYSKKEEELLLERGTQLSNQKKKKRWSRDIGKSYVLVVYYFILKNRQSELCTHKLWMKYGSVWLTLRFYRLFPITLILILLLCPQQHFNQSDPYASCYKKLKLVVGVSSVASSLIANNTTGSICWSFPFLFLFLLIWLPPPHALIL